MGVGNLGVNRSIKATLLLLLFVFALGAQAAHQIYTPAKPAKECGAISEKTILYGMLRSERAEAWMLEDKYLEALKDCQEVINAQRENAAAWTVRAEVLIALGKADEA